MTSAHALPFGGLPGRHWRPDPRKAMALHEMWSHRGPGPGPRGPRRHRERPPWGRGGVGGPYGQRRRRRPRGDVRAALLLLLAEQPFNGYGLMQEIEQRSNGEWRPSPGSVYPALSQLEDEGLVRSEEPGGRKQF